MEPAEQAARALYEAWRDKPSLSWDEIAKPSRPSPPGVVDETPHFVARWLRVADALLTRERAARREERAEYTELEQAVRDYLISPGVPTFLARLTRLAWRDQQTSYGPPLRRAPAGRPEGGLPTVFPPGWVSSGTNPAGDAGQT